MAALLAVLFIATRLISNLPLFGIILGSTKRIHNRVLDAVLATGVSFFDANPAGRILNRFAKDIAVLDSQLTVNMLLFIMILS